MRATAQVFTCISQADCAHGYTCQPKLVVGGHNMCMLSLCDTDADCPPDIRCVHPSEPRCLPPRQCTDDAGRGQCMPYWLAPCTADGDCGPYMHCVEEQSCGCWYERERPDMPCGCEGAGVFYCGPVPYACDPDDAASCPPGWPCGQFQPTHYECTQRDPDAGSSGSCDFIEEPWTRTCQPPLFMLVQSHREFSIPTDDTESGMPTPTPFQGVGGSSGGMSAGSFGQVAGTGVAGTGVAGSAAAGSPVAGSSVAAPSAAGSAEAGTSPAPPTSAPAAPTAMPSPTDSRPGSGCAVTTPASTPPSGRWMILAVSLAMLTRRRR